MKIHILYSSPILWKPHRAERVFDPTLEKEVINKTSLCNMSVHQKRFIDELLKFNEIALGSINRTIW